VNPHSTGPSGRLTPATTRHIRLQRESAKKHSTAERGRFRRAFRTIRQLVPAKGASLLGVWGSE